MKRSKFSEEQVAYALRQAEAGTAVGDVCRQLGNVTGLRSLPSRVSGRGEPTRPPPARRRPGIDTLTAITLVAELHDVRRFPSARAFCNDFACRRAIFTEVLGECLCTTPT